MWRNCRGWLSNMGVLKILNVVRQSKSGGRLIGVSIPIVFLYNSKINRKKER